MNYKLNTNVGNDFSTVAEKAKQITAEQNAIVEFEFNGVTCLVSKDTNLEWLYRDYANSWTMDWKQVGSDCVKEYDKETKAELKKRKAIAEEKADEQNRQYKIKEAKERAAFKEKTAHVKMEFKSKADWELGLSKNKDAYGGCVYEYAEGWAKLMQVEMVEGKKLEDVAEKTSHEMGFLGITGFMYGAAVSVLSHCWLHGEKLRKWHNKEYKHEGDGVVNPAVLTIG